MLLSEARVPTGMVLHNDAPAAGNIPNYENCWSTPKSTCDNSLLARTTAYDMASLLTSSPLLHAASPANATLPGSPMLANLPTPPPYRNPPPYLYPPPMDWSEFLLTSPQNYYMQPNQFQTPPQLVPQNGQMFLAAGNGGCQSPVGQVVPSLSPVHHSEQMRREQLAKIQNGSQFKQEMSLNYENYENISGLSGMLTPTSHDSNNSNLQGNISGDQQPSSPSSSSSHSSSRNSPTSRNSPASDYQNITELSRTSPCTSDYQNITNFDYQNVSGASHTNQQLVQDESRSSTNPASNFLLPAAARHSLAEANPLAGIASYPGFPPNLITSSPHMLRKPQFTESNYMTMNGGMNMTNQMQTSSIQQLPGHGNAYLDYKEKELHSMWSTMEKEGHTLPPITMKASNAFTEADIKALKPWRDQLLMKLIIGQKQTTTPPTNTEAKTEDKSKDSNPRPLKIRRLKRSRNAQEIFKLSGIRNVTYFDFGQGNGYKGLIVNGSPGFEDIIFSMDQANSGFQNIRHVIETILTTCLEQPLTSYSLTGRALQQLTEVRNGLPTQRAVMSDVGTSKLSIPEQLISGIADFLSTWLVEPESFSKGKAMINYVRALISKTCSRNQEKAKGKESKKQKLLSCIM